MLSKRQNLLETIRGGHPDRYVNQYEFVQLVSDPIRKANYFGCPKGQSVVNSWGITIEWPEYTPGPFPNTSPEKVVIRDIERWRDDLHVPDLTFSEEEWAPFIEAAAKVDRSEYFVTMTLAPGIFEKLHYLMGMEEALMAFYTAPDKMRELIGFLADWEIAVGKEVIPRLHPDALFQHDDWGSQVSSFISPAMFDEFLLEPYRKIYGFYKENGIQVIIHHSDSYAANLVPEMIEMGVDIWQGAMTTNDLPALQKKYPGRITLMGGIDNGLVDRKDWTPENCMKYTRAIIDACEKEYFIPCTTMGGPDSTYPGVYECVSNCIDLLSKEKF